MLVLQLLFIKYFSFFPFFQQFLSFYFLCYSFTHNFNVYCNSILCLNRYSVFVTVPSPSFQICPLITCSCPYISWLVKSLIHTQSFYFTCKIKKSIFLTPYMFSHTLSFPSPTCVWSCHTHNIYALLLVLLLPSAKLNPGRPGSSLMSTALCQA